MNLTFIISICFAAFVGGGTFLYFKHTKQPVVWWKLAAWSAAAFAGVWLIYFLTETLPDLGSE